MCVVKSMLHFPPTVSYATSWCAVISFFFFFFLSIGHRVKADEADLGTRARGPSLSSHSHAHTTALLCDIICFRTRYIYIFFVQYYIVARAREDRRLAFRHPRVTSSFQFGKMFEKTARHVSINAYAHTHTHRCRSHFAENRTKPSRTRGITDSFASFARKRIFAIYFVSHMMRDASRFNK